MNAALLFSIIPAILAFVFGILMTPIVTHFLYECKVWKKSGGKTAINGEAARYLTN